MYKYLELIRYSGMSSVVFTITARLFHISIVRCFSYQNPGNGLVLCVTAKLKRVRSAIVKGN